MLFESWSYRWPWYRQDFKFQENTGIDVDFQKYVLINLQGSNFSKSEFFTLSLKQQIIVSDLANKKFEGEYVRVGGINELSLQVAKLALNWKVPWQFFEAL